jgi:hypothetical protein
MEVKVDNNWLQNSSKSTNNICTFFTYVHLRMLRVLGFLTESWQTSTDFYCGVMLWHWLRSFVFLILGRKFWRKICKNHRVNCGTVSQWWIKIAQYAARFCQILGEAHYVLHILEQTFIFPMSAERQFSLLDLDLYCYVEKLYVSNG